jgi:hypothetical protein
MSDQTGLDASAEWIGHWWLPNEPDQIVPGVLRYVPDEGLQLSLIGGFAHRESHRLDETRVVVTETTSSWPVILGIADNKKVTLLECFPTRSTSYGVSERPQTQTVFAHTALVGAHIKGEEDEVFTSSFTSVENLTQWSELSALRALDSRDGLVSVEPVHEPSAVVDGATIALFHEHTFPHFEKRRGQTIGQIREAVSVRFQPEKPISLRATIDSAAAFQDLISLATHRACSILWLRLRALPEERDHPAGRPIRDREVDVYFHGMVRGDAHAKAVGPREMLFTCGHVSFEKVLPRWWILREKCLAASNLVLGVRYAPASYLESNLLSAVGAAEAMHRALNLDHTHMPSEEFQALRAKLLEITPHEHHLWLKGRIRNEPTLRERLHALAGRADTEAIRELVPDVEQWSSATTRARRT